MATDKKKLLEQAGFSPELTARLAAEDRLAEEVGLTDELVQRTLDRVTRELSHAPPARLELAHVRVSMSMRDDVTETPAVARSGWARFNLVLATLATGLALGAFGWSYQLKTKLDVTNAALAQRNLEIQKQQDILNAAAHRENSLRKLAEEMNIVKLHDPAAIKLYELIATNPLPYDPTVTYHK